MKLSQLVNQAWFIIPRYTDIFTGNSIEGTAILQNNEYIITSHNHGLETGKVAIEQVSTVQNKIIDVGISDDLERILFTTEKSHDLTYGFEKQQTIKLEGFAEQVFNDDVELIAVPNRNQFKIKNPQDPLTGAPTIDGNQFLIEPLFKRIAGAQFIEVVNANTFKFQALQDCDIDLETNVFINQCPFIAGHYNQTIEAIQQEYNNQKEKRPYLFIALDATRANKTGGKLDTLQENTLNSDFRTTVTQNFSCYFADTITTQKNGVEFADLIHDVVRPVLWKTFLNSQMESFTPLIDQVKDDERSRARNKYSINFLGDSLAFYSDAYAIHRFDFSMNYELDRRESYEHIDSIAFRDVYMNITTKCDDEERQTITEFQLDEEEYDGS